MEINSSVKISDSPTLEIKTLYFVDQDANVIAYSPPPSRYTGALKLNVVATVPSAEILISAGSLIISEKGSIFCVGTPFCIVRIWNVMGISMSSFVWKNTSQLVMNTPVSSTTWNDCARGSYHSITLFVVVKESITLVDVLEPINSVALLL